MFTAALDAIFAPVLLLDPIWAIIIASLLISIMSTMAYKLMTNQELMKKLKGDIKKHQDEMKGYKDNPEKMMSIQKKAMDVNMKYMAQSMRPTLITFPIIILLLPWLSSHYSYNPIAPMEPFEIRVMFNSAVQGDIYASSVPAELTFDKTVKQISGNNASFIASGPAGRYELDFEYSGSKYTIPTLISDDLESLEPVKTFKNSVVSKIEINQTKLQPMGDLSLFGWKPKWLGTYIIFSLIFSMSLRKILNIY
ncbi:EMC3/TMCO1 family protein [Candidatus Woesearchaeota archaeon]|nr:EMC3/TMCO1 family protein [Candidatus Woesearchaeota archaeon]